MYAVLANETALFTMYFFALFLQIVKQIGCPNVWGTIFELACQRYL